MSLQILKRKTSIALEHDLASLDGSPMNFLISALSTKARSMDPVMFDVVRTNTLGYLFMLSICVSTALTTLMASEGSFPED